MTRGKIVLVWIAAATALAVVGAGALVNANQAALSVPDWPLSYGKVLLLDWAGNVKYEQLHRLLAALTLLLTATTLWIARSLEPGSSARRLTAWLATGLTVQILLGGFVVLSLNPPWLGVVHLLLGVSVATGFLVLPAEVGQSARATTVGTEGKERWVKLCRRGRTVMILLTLQVILGALSRHPPLGESWFISSLLIHVLNGFVALAFVIALAIGVLRFRAIEGMRGWAVALLLMALVQLAVGVWVFFVAPEPMSETYPPPDGFPTAHTLHVLLGVTILGASTVIYRKLSGSTLELNG